MLDIVAFKNVISRRSLLKGAPLVPPQRSHSTACRQAKPWACKQNCRRHCHTGLIGNVSYRRHYNLGPNLPPPNPSKIANFVIRSATRQYSYPYRVPIFTQSSAELSAPVTTSKSRQSKY